MLLHHQTIAIIGAGPVGLTLARLLQQQDINVRVYERDANPQARIWGGPLDLHKGSGQDAMKSAGLLDQYYALSKPMGRALADEQGNIFFTKPIGPEDRYENPEINRNHLRQLLLSSLNHETVVWDRKLTALEPHQGAWALHFDKGESVFADVVIGANGAMSNVRRYVTNTEVEYTGTYIIQGEVTEPKTHCPEFYGLCNGNILMISGRGYNFVANPDNNGALTYAVTFRKPAEWLQENGLNFQDSPSIAGFLSALFPNSPDAYHEVFRASTRFVGLPARQLPLDKPWNTQRPLPITLIGDAAHLMPPFAGQGVNTGMKDALILSENLTNGKHPSIEAAIRDYEHQMFQYAGQAQAETSQNEHAMHLPDFSFQKRFMP